jgi:hypothetical protein
MSSGKDSTIPVSNRVWTPKDPETRAALLAAEAEYGPVQRRPVSGWKYEGGAFARKDSESKRYGTGGKAHGNAAGPRRQCLWCGRVNPVGWDFHHRQDCPVAKIVS